MFNKVKLITIIIPVIIIAYVVLIVYFQIRYVISFPQIINYNKKINLNATLKFMEDKNFKEFLLGFKPIKLPLRFNAKSNKYQDFKDIPDNFISKYLFFYKACSSTYSYFDSINENRKNIENLIKNLSGNIEIKHPKYFLLPVINEEYSSCIFIMKIYNDDFKSKTQIFFLVTFDKKGIPISCLKVGEENYYYTKDNKKYYENFTMCTIKEDLVIELQNQSWGYDDEGGYGTAGWQSPVYYKINNDGRILKIEEKKLPLKRDE